jgi:hypothetical protein
MLRVLIVVAAHMLVVGYGYGINAPRNGGFGGHSNDTQFEFKWGRIRDTASERPDQ